MRRRSGIGIGIIAVILVAVLLIVLIVCIPGWRGQTDDPSSGTTDVPGTQDPEDSSAVYTIDFQAYSERVDLMSYVEFNCSKTQAKAGERIELTIRKNPDCLYDFKTIWWMETDLSQALEQNVGQNWSWDGNGGIYGNFTSSGFSGHFIMPESDLTISVEMTRSEV